MVYAGARRSMKRLWFVLALACAALPGTAPVTTHAASPSQRGSALYFFGWSRDSRLIAYTRQRVGRTRPDQRMHRYVEGGEFTGFGKKVGGDVERYARERDYVIKAATKRRLSDTRFELDYGGKTYTLAIEVGQAQMWRLALGDMVVGEHAFDRIYVGFDVDFFPSPDGAQAIVVMHLDTGWEIDAAIFPVLLTRN